MAAPQRLSINPMSPHYNREAANRVDKVFVDGVWLPNCVAYDIPAGWAMALANGVWQPKVYGIVRVEEKQL